MTIVDLAGKDLRVFIRLKEGLFTLLKVDRTSQGLYLMSAQPSGGPDRHYSFHTDGVQFIHENGRRVASSESRPLTDCAQPRSIFASHFMIHTPFPGWTPKTTIRPKDMLIDRAGLTGVELMLTDRVMDLPEDDGRINSEVHARRWLNLGPPVLLIEVFTLTVDERGPGLGVPGRFDAGGPPWTWDASYVNPGAS